jgi:site-specific DNA-methyltransferase (adenine-specific)
MIELNKTYNESCLVTMNKMPNNFVKLTITSPPYDDLRTYNKNIGGNKQEYNGYSFPFEEIAKELYRITQDGGVVVWVVSDAVKNGSESGTSFRQALYFKEVGFNIHDTMIYRKLNPPPNAGTRYQQMFEYMFVLSKNKPKSFNGIKDKENVGCGRITTGTWRDVDGTTKPKSKVNQGVTPKFGLRGNVWSIKTTTGKNDHPATFPEQLAYDHIISWSNEGDTVLDCFLGSGTTGKVAKQLNRKFIGIEISQEYLDIAKRRING